LTTLNRYLEVMVDVITNYGGTINEILGDGIFVIFGAPIQADDDAERAVACAIAMQLALIELNQQHQALNLLPLEMGIGVHTGEVLAGNIGSQTRTKYAIVGKNVNLTSRIESLTVGGQVLISQDTLKQIDSRVLVGQPEQVQLKGFQEPVSVYQVFGMEGRFTLELPQQEDALICLESELSLVYTVVEEKQVATEEWHGSIVRLSSHAAVLTAEHPLDVHQNLKIRLILKNDPNQNDEDIYAKVVKVLSDQPRCLLIHFTYVPSELQALFNTLIS